LASAGPKSLHVVAPRLPLPRLGPGGLAAQHAHPGAGPAAVGLDEAPARGALGGGVGLLTGAGTAAGGVRLGEGGGAGRRRPPGGPEEPAPPGGDDREDGGEEGGGDGGEPFYTVTAGDAQKRASLR